MDYKKIIKSEKEFVPAQPVKGYTKAVEDAMDTSEKNIQIQEKQKEEEVHGKKG
jgi:hypothetical protein